MEDGGLNGYYPVALHVKGKRIVVAGGGKVAERRIAGLLEAGADDVLVASPEATAQIREWEAAGRLQWRRRPVAPEDLNGALLVLAATDSEETNARLAAEASRRGILCNAADAGAHSDFITPAVWRSGDVIIAATASGASPALAALLKRQLAELYGDRLAAAAVRLRALRELALRQVADAETRRLLLQLAAEEALAGENAQGGGVEEVGSGMEKPAARDGEAGEDDGHGGQISAGGQTSNGERSSKDERLSGGGQTMNGEADGREGGEDVRRWLLHLLARTNERLGQNER